MKDLLYIVPVAIVRAVLRIIPFGKIRQQQVFFSSYLGRQYSCNPKYISEYIQEHKLNYKIIWAFRDVDEYKYLEKQGITVVKYYSFAFIKAIMTSGFIITNTRDLLYIPFSKKQTVINTWHGGGAYKKVGVDRKNSTISEKYRGRILQKSPIVFLSSCKMASDVLFRKSFLHKGPILATGMPRNDILINQSANKLNRAVRAKFNLKESDKILLYAPTFRDNKEVSDYQLQVNDVKKALHKRFDGEWVIFFRSHYYLANQIDNEKYINVSDYSDMQELLYVSDVLITDFSSSIWDFSYTGKPCFLYATDLEKYNKEQGFFTDIHTWPFALAETNERLIENILAFDEKKYQKNVDEHHKEFGSYEKGNACKEVVKYMRLVQKNRRKK